MEIYGLSFIYEWLEKNSYVLLYLGIFSFCIFFISIFGIKYFAAKIPKDYFTNKQRVSRLKESSLALWLVYIVIKNFKDNFRALDIGGSLGTHTSIMRSYGLSVDIIDKYENSISKTIHTKYSSQRNEISH